MLKTESNAKVVLGYYLSFAAREGWITDDSPADQFVILQKDGIKISLMASESELEDTTVFITMANADD